AAAEPSGSSMVNARDSLAERCKLSVSRIPLANSLCASISLLGALVLAEIQPSAADYLNSPTVSSRLGTSKMGKSRRIPESLRPSFNIHERPGDGASGACRIIRRFGLYDNHLQFTSFQLGDWRNSVGEERRASRFRRCPESP